jgi:hypothetical protein
LALEKRSSFPISPEANELLKTDKKRYQIEVIADASKLFDELWLNQRNADAHRRFLNILHAAKRTVEMSVAAKEVSLNDLINLHREIVDAEEYERFLLSKEEAKQAEVCYFLRMDDREEVHFLLKEKVITPDRIPQRVSSQEKALINLETTVQGGKVMQDDQVHQEVKIARQRYLWRLRQLVIRLEHFEKDAKAFHKSSLSIYQYLKTAREYIEGRVEMSEAAVDYSRAVTELSRTVGETG